MPNSSPILQSEDVSHFYFDIDVLAVLSDFFKTFAGDTALTTHDDIISLPSATTAGLAHALNLIRSSIRGKPIPYAQDSVAFDAFVIADAYDLPIIRLLLSRSYAILKRNDPFMAFAIAGASNDEQLARIASRSTTICDQDIRYMSPEAIRLLERFNPDCLLRLRDLHSRHRMALLQFEALAKLTKMHDRHDYFGRKCCKKINGCRTYKFVGGQWTDLRNLVAESAVAAAKIGKSTGFGVGQIVQCGTCRTRLTLTIDEAWKDSLGRVADTI